MRVANRSSMVLLSLGEWQEFSLYLVYLFLPVAQFGFIITQFGQAAASAKRIYRDPGCQE